ncbi:potassium uptake TrkH family protein [Catenuloplanes nepalensis]|uniref:Potassium uptake TrkH family protein n=1 Tax=Catenuloplanes nepalensis TaxID=587533 RepID=A0ABT9N5W7_9ACTN|nr:potassium uptake TrkH family protein [Catenuloplanes nepalensis]
MAFLALVVLGTALMMLPVSRAEPGFAPFVTALFTATSAVCVTGLAVVDTGTYWSPFGLGMMTVLTQIGGLGIMVMATLLGVLISQRLGLRGRLMAQTESRTLETADIRRMVLRIVAVSFVCEAVIAVAVGLRFWLGYDYSFGRAMWEGVFHSIQAFNNGGFALYPDSLMRFVGDPWICLPLVFGVMLGSIGFPVIFELARRWRKPHSWSTHTRLTVWGSLVLAVTGFILVLAFEWNNAGTFGPLNWGDKVLAAFTQDVMTRSGGFNSVDFGAMNQETLTISTALMFIGGGSGSTSGGIKLTTFFLLGFVILAEIRGEPDVVIGRRRIAETTQRQAMTVALLGVALVGCGTLALLFIDRDITLDRAIFEATSAFATVGLSTGITPTLPESGQVVLVILMYVGRVGTIAVGSAIALNSRQRLYRYPEERPIVG